MTYTTFNIPFLKNSKYGHPQFDRLHTEDGKVVQVELEELAPTLFQSKTEYLAWRQEWKKAYKQLSKEIRHAKNNRKDDYKDDTYAQYQWVGRAQNGREVARRMMALLEAAKAESYRQKTQTQEEAA